MIIIIMIILKLTRMMKIITVLIIEMEMIRIVKAITIYGFT